MTHDRYGSCLPGVGEGRGESSRVPPQFLLLRAAVLKPDFDLQGFVRYLLK